MNIYNLNRYELLKKCNDILDELQKEKSIFEQRIVNDYARYHDILWFKCERKTPLVCNDVYEQFMKPYDYAINRFAYLNRWLYWDINEATALVNKIEFAISINGDIRLDNSEIEFIMKKTK